jgi:hypothetical protein
MLMPRQQSKLFEGLRRGDLKDSIDPIFTIDQFRSKMGQDKDIIVLRFRANDKNPAIDVMEFLEKGYPFVLDADISSGEEKDGKYSVFVELERTPQAASQIKEIVNGISQLCANEEWKFRFHKDYHSKDFSEDTITEEVPLTPEDYESRLTEMDTMEANEFFDQGALDEVSVDNESNITFEKPFAESLTAKLVAIGEYNDLKDTLPGAIQLDEASRSQTAYLEKYLGNYDINKINEHFLIRNGKRAAIIKKDNW